jgi:hypothetical protein
MITIGFRANEEKEYKIVRDYYTYYHKKEGVIFILASEDDTQTFSKFLPRSQMNNDYEWQKARNGDVHYLAAGVESGKESKLIIETGFIKMKSKFTQKEETYTYRRYRFILNSEK